MISARESPRAFRPLVWAWAAAVLFLCVLYFDGLRTWFIADDFAWLSLLRQTTSFRSLLHSLFAPAAQGTMRFLSERAFFIVFERVFGFYNLPWRIAVFLTAAADIALIIRLCLAATGSRLAAGIAPFFWVANATLATVMAWDSAWNEVLCAFFLMSALTLFDNYLTTGRQKFWWWQMVVFTLGFGALEINTVYPALAALWLLTIRRGQARKLVSVLPGGAISVGYFLLHRAIAPFQAGGPYAFHIDGRIFRTFALYWKWSFVTQYWEVFGHSRRLGIVIVLAGSAVLLGSFIRGWIQGRRELLFFAGWFLLTLGPMLPLPNHLTDYYLTIPAIGLAMFAGEAVADAVNAGIRTTAVAAVLIGVWLIAMIPTARHITRDWYENSEPVRALVLGADAAQQAHPSKVIVIDGVTDSLWDNAFAHSAFLPFDLNHIELTPGTGDRIHPTLNVDRIADLELPRDVIRNAVTHSEVVVYSIHGDHLRNITDEYARSARAWPPSGTPRRIDIGSPLFAYLLSSEWFPIEDGTRWMPGHASLKLAAPAADEGLVLDGYYLLQHSDGIEHLSVTIDGIPVGSTAITGNDPNRRFHRLFRLPPALFDNSRAGRSSVIVEFGVDPVLHDTDGTERGLIFGTVALKKGLF